MPSTQVEEGRPSRTVSSPITETVSESMHIPSSGPSNITSSSSTVLELLTSGFVEIPTQVMIPILSVIVLQLAAEVAEEDISLGQIAGPHEVIVQVLLDQFFTYIKIVLPMFL